MFQILFGDSQKKKPLEEKHEHSEEVKRLLKKTEYRQIEYKN
jgi:hypothetical protein